MATPDPYPLTVVGDPDGDLEAVQRSIDLVLMPWARKWLRERLGEEGWLAFLAGDGPALARAMRTAGMEAGDGEAMEVERESAAAWPQAHRALAGGADEDGRQRLPVYVAAHEMDGAGAGAT